ncbi:MAG: hypothetical protein B7X78_09235, partial [Sphingomonadales bacterium 39-62-4]
MADTGPQENTDADEAAGHADRHTPGLGAEHHGGVVCGLETDRCFCLPVAAQLHTDTSKIAE